MVLPVFKRHNKLRQNSRNSVIEHEVGCWYAREEKVK